jgi:hypothetical protein
VQEIHFTPDDLARVTIAAGPDLMVELVGSMHGLATGALDRKRRPRLAPPVAPSPMRLLFEFAQALEWVPDFLTPAGRPGSRLASPGCSRPPRDGSGRSWRPSVDRYGCMIRGGFAARCVARFPATTATCSLRTGIR